MMIAPLLGRCGSLDSGASPKDAILADPSIDPATVVSDLKSPALDRLHKMQVLFAVYLAQHDVAYLDGMGDDLHQAELFQGVLAHTLNNGGHGAPAPERFRQPLADLGPVRLADLKVVQAAPADQSVFAGANGKMSGLAVPLGGLGDQCQPFVSSNFGVWEPQTILPESRFLAKTFPLFSRFSLDRE